MQYPTKIYITLITTNAPYLQPHQTTHQRSHRTNQDATNSHTDKLGWEKPKEIGPQTRIAHSAQAGWRPYRGRPGVEAGDAGGVPDEANPAKWAAA
jgi:hypothetical protein